MIGFPPKARGNDKFGGFISQIIKHSTVFHIEPKNLLLSDILIRFCEQIPYIFVVIWCLDIVKISPEGFGILTAVEMITSAIIYIPVANFSDKMERKPFVAISFIFLQFFR
jgi:hypothetical protein